MNGADLGSGRGPWTVQEILRPEDERPVRVVVDGCCWDSYSRYAEPDADGVIPVFKTTQCKLQLSGTIH